MCVYIYSCCYIFRHRLQGASIHFRKSELPDYIRLSLPLIGSNEMYTNEDNLIRIPRLTFVYMILMDNGKTNTSEWGRTGDRSDSNGYLNLPDELSSSQAIYRRVLSPGNYILSNIGATYLFTFDLPGKFI